MVHINSAMIELPLPPSTNNAYVNTPRGRRLSQKARAYKRDVQERLMEAGWRNFHLRLPLSLSIWYYLPDDKRRRDISNMVKILEDAIAEFMGYDDSRNAEIHLYRRVSEYGVPCVMVRLESVKGE